MGLRVSVSILVLAWGGLAGMARGHGQTPSQPMSGAAAPQAGAMVDGMGHDMQMGMSKPKVPAGPLKVMFGDKSAEWTADTLAALPHKTITVFNEHTKANQTFTGVELIELLTPMGVSAKPHGKDLGLYLVAEGSDGYRVAYSIGEVSPELHEATILVADALDGKPIGDSGPLQLVATGEKRPARWVRNLVAVRVRPIE